MFLLVFKEGKKTTNNRPPFREQADRAEHETELRMKHIPISKVRILAIAAAVLFAAVSMNSSLFAFPADDEMRQLPTDPLEGRLPFEEKYCIKCHAIGGAGGEIGPDLSKVRFKGSFLDLSAVLWNHIPDMVVEYKNLILPWPDFTDGDVYSLISYIYYLRYLGEPGSVANGKRLIHSKGCVYCHSVGGKEGGDVGPGLDKLKRYVSPIYMVQSIWNHGPMMLERMNQMGIEIPTFSGREIADMSAYIRAVSRYDEQEKVYLSPGNPNKGEKIFEKKGCLSCHSVGKRGGSIGPDLDEIDLNQSVTEIAGMMWNHGEKMWQEMRSIEIEWTTFSGKEMADLIAYLYFINFQDPAGNAGRGRDVFFNRCISCHSVKGEGGTIGSDLYGASYLESSLSILRAMINKADKMSETALDMGTNWPAMSGKEMRDLFAYIKILKKPSETSEPGE